MLCTHQHAYQRASLSDLCICHPCVHPLRQHWVAGARPGRQRLSADPTQSYTNHAYIVLVAGKVVEVFETGKAIHLDSGKPRPEQTFTVLIAQAKAPSLPALP